MSDLERFEQSADMRLIEYHRKQLGKGAPPPTRAWSGAASEVLQAAAPVDTPQPAVSGARLSVDVFAMPEAGLIPGAVVTLSVIVQSDGTLGADDVRLAVPLPGETEYRAGSLLIDGRATEEAAEAFLGAGLAIPVLAAGRRMTALWKVKVRTGTHPIIVAPRVTSRNAGIVGGNALVLSRAERDLFAPLPEQYKPPEPLPERPFYELDDDEAHDFGAREVSSDEPLMVMPDVAPLEVLPEPALEVAAPEVEIPAAFAVEPLPLPTPVEIPAPAPTVRDVRLGCSLDAATVALVQKMFEGESYGQIAHYLLQNALACSLTGTTDSLRGHFAQQGALLSRALLSRKLRKPLKVSDFSTGATSLDLREAFDDIAATSPRAPLWMPLTAADVEFCAGSDEAHDALASFIRIRQLAVALQVRCVDVADPQEKGRIETLLAEYARSARSVINRIFIRSKLTRDPDPFPASDPASDALARRVINALSRVLQA